MIIQNYSFYPIDSRMYCLIENEKAVVVDPCKSEVMLQCMIEKKIRVSKVLLTHEHYDHISGVNWLREHFEGVTVLCSKTCAQAIPEPTKNISAFSNVLYMDKNMDKPLDEYGWDFEYSCTADEVFENEIDFEWEGHHFFLKETPGHSKGSICIILDDKYLFSGDSLVSGHSTITRLPGGSKKDFLDISIPFLKSLDSEIIVYPGHGELQLLRQFEM